MMAISSSLRGPGLSGMRFEYQLANVVKQRSEAGCGPAPNRALIGDKNQRVKPDWKSGPRRTRLSVISGTRCSQAKVIGRPPRMTRCLSDDWRKEAEPSTKRAC